MENGYHLNLISDDFLKDREWKAANHDASQSCISVGIHIGTSDNSRKCLVDTSHEFDVQVFALVSVLMACFGEFRIGFGSKPNDHLRLAGFHEFRFNLFPGSTNSAAMVRIASRRFKPSIQFSLLRLSKLKSFVLFGNSVPNLFHQEDSFRDAEFLCGFG